jgi:integrase
VGHIEDRWHSAKTKEPTARYGTGRRWRYRYTDPDGRECSASFDRKADAERFKAKVDGDMLRGTYLDPNAGKVLLREYAEQWLASRSMDITSHRTVSGRVRNHIHSGLGDKRLDQLARSPSIISGWLAGLKTGPSYAGDVFSTLSAILGAAVDDGLIGRNPCKAGSVKAPRVVRRKIIPWTAAQVAAVRAALPGRYQATADCGSGLGMRQGEILGLEADAVGFLQRKVTVRLQVRTIAGGAMVFAPPKGGRTREVPLPRAVSLALAEHMRLYPPREVTLPWRTPDGKPYTAKLIFTAPRGGAINRNKFNTLAWRPARRKAGLAPARENGMHALRHHYASALLASGRVDIRRLSEYLGHHDPAFTLRVYAHLMPNAEERAIRDIEAALEEAQEPGSDGPEKDQGYRK